MLNAEQKGYVFNIQRASLDDGPGVRTVLFLKGCPLRCPWCHNPEGQNMLPEILVRQEKCIKCGACKTACPVNAIENASLSRRDCISCDLCASVCAYDALDIAGKQYTVSEAVNELLADKNFFEATGGGVTLSGGEPLMQPDFSLDMLKALKSTGVNTCIETCGICADGTIEKLAPYIDHWLFDVKLTDEKMHQKVLGIPLSDVLKSLYILKNLEISITIRCSVIPGINDNDEYFSFIRNLASDIKAKAVDILPYHRLGRDKYIRLGRKPPPDIRTPSAETVALWEKAII